MTTKTIPSPLEDVFGITPKSTPAPIQGNAETALYSDEEQDQSEREKESQVDKQFDEIYTSAIEAFENQNNLTQQIDPRYSARNAEVGAQYLKIALDAAQSKANKVINNKKLKVASGQSVINNDGGTINNNVIVADRNELLKLMKAARKEKDVI